MRPIVNNVVCGPYEMYRPGVTCRRLEMLGRGDTIPSYMTSSKYFLYFVISRYANAHLV